MALPVSGAIRLAQLGSARSTELCAGCGMALVLLGAVVEGAGEMFSASRAVCLACPSTG